jgi:hypothetical protein
MDITEWLKNEDIQQHFRKASNVVVAAVYNEVYVYIWFICVYNIFLLVIVVINLYLLVRLWRGGDQFMRNDKNMYDQT